MPDEATGPPATGHEHPTGSGFGRVLVAVYAVFAVGATTRSTVQLITRFEQAPVAYLLSGFAGIVYIVATVALARSGHLSSRVALVAISVEAVGVLAVGTLSFADPALFPDATVWSHFGQGYLFIPLVLPFVGLWWLWRHRRPDSRW